MDNKKITLTDGNTTIDYNQCIEGMENTRKWLLAHKGLAIRDVKTLASQGRIRSKKRKEIAEKWEYICSNLAEVERDLDYFKSMVKSKLDETNAPKTN